MDTRSFANNNSYKYMCAFLLFIIVVLVVFRDAFIFVIVVVVSLLVCVFRIMGIPRIVNCFVGDVKQTQYVYLRLVCVQ